MPQFARVKFQTTTTGTSNLAVGAGIDSASLGDGLTPAEAGVTNGQAVDYYVIDGGSWAYGRGSYNTTGPVITRATNETHWNGVTLSTTGKRTLNAGTKTVFFAPMPDAYTNVKVGNGAVGSPSVAAEADPDTGMYFSADGKVAFSGNGTQALELDPGNQVASFGTSIGIVAGASGYFSSPNGSAGGPGFRFQGLGGLSTGLYHPADDQLSVSAGGVQMMNFVEGATDYIDAKVPIYIPSGTTSNPGISFSANVDCGLIYEAVGIITVVAEGAKSVYFTNSGLQMVQGKNFYLSQSGHTVPSSASDSGFAGALSWDTGFIYVCTASNTWKRVAIASW